MFSPTVMPVRIIRACNHSAVVELRYRGLRDKSQQQENERSFFCADCKALTARLCWQSG